MRAGFGTYVPPNRRGGITASATTKEPASSIPVVVQQPLKTKSLLPAKNRQETVVATTQLEPVETVLIAKPLPTREINDPEPASKIPTALPLPPAIITTSSSSTNETVKDVHMAEKKGERKPKVSRGTTGVYVPPSRRAAAAAAAVVVNEADTEIPEVITKKRKLSTDGSAHSAVHPTLGDVTMGLTSSRSKSNSDDTTLLPTTKRGRGFHKLLMEQANAEEISERKRMGMLKLIQQSETDQCIEGTTNIEASRPETVFLEEVSASQRMIFHSLGIVVKKTALS